MGGTPTVSVSVVITIITGPVIGYPAVKGGGGVWDIISSMHTHNSNNECGDY